MVPREGEKAEESSDAREKDSKVLLPEAGKEQQAKAFQGVMTNVVTNAHASCQQGTRRQLSTVPLLDGLRNHAVQHRDPAFPLNMLCMPHVPLPRLPSKPLPQAGPPCEFYISDSTRSHTLTPCKSISAVNSVHHALNPISLHDVYACLNQGWQCVHERHGMRVLPSYCRRSPKC